MNLIDRIPPDKCRHAIAGALVYLLVASAATLAGGSHPPVAIGLIAALAVGAGKEAMDHLVNARAIDAGQPPPHEVSAWDALATVLGACVPALASVLGGIWP